MGDTIQADAHATQHIHNNNSITIASVAITICASGLLSVAFQVNGRREFACARGIMPKRASPVAFQINGRRVSLMPVLPFHQFDRTNIQSDREFFSSCVRGSSKITKHHRTRHVAEVDESIRLSI
jgi:hypothetical protein